METLEKYAQALRKNHFEVFLAQDAKDASEIFFNRILPSLSPRVISWGGSKTLIDTGILERLKQEGKYELIVTAAPDLSFEEKWEARRQALLSDLFLSGTNAVTQEGELVNLDGYGNRVAALSFGPKNVVLFIGKNKLTGDLAQAMDRVKNYAALLNVQRFDHLKTPCKKTGRCHRCKSEDSICNAWSIINQSYPAGRIKIILINQEMGF